MKVDAYLYFTDYLKSIENYYLYRLYKYYNFFRKKISISYFN